MIVNTLFIKLESSNLSFCIGDHYAGVVANSNDPILLSSNRTALKKLLDLSVSHLVQCGFNLVFKNLLDAFLVQLLHFLA